MSYTVMSPWAKADNKKSVGLAPRVDSLNGKTVGLFAHFKGHAVIILKEIEKLLAERYPDAKFSHFQYPVELVEIVNDREYDIKLKDWLKDVDTVITAHGDAGSCSMCLAYNTAYIEKLGVPAVVLSHPYYETATRRGGTSKAVPGLRVVLPEIWDLSGHTVIDEPVISRLITPKVTEKIDEIIEALTAPLTEDEKNPPEKEDHSTLEFTGSITDVADFFYSKGWTTGLPVIPPTAEAVNEMLQGTDLPRDHVVTRLPPMWGYATVEKIAVNAVMAGCLPTYMPVLIAAVKGMMDPKVQLEGWTCSNASWMPFTVINGPVRNDIGVHSGAGILSSSFKPNSAIPRALAYITMNIAGVRPLVEDMSAMGSIARAGVCIGENEEDSPWQPLHTFSGFDKEDSAVTMFWPFDTQMIGGGLGRYDSIDVFLKYMCEITAWGWQTGAALILSPDTAKLFAENGWDQNRIMDYIVEYNRIPGHKWNLRWIVESNHLPENMDIPLDPSYSTRRFWSKEHMFVVVGGRIWGMALTGGGDHGGPSCTKIELPNNWDELVKKYRSVKPSYLNY